MYLTFITTWISVAVTPQRTHRRSAGRPAGLCGGGCTRRRRGGRSTGSGASTSARDGTAARTPRIRRARCQPPKAPSLPLGESRMRARAIRAQFVARAEGTRAQREGVAVGPAPRARSRSPMRSGRRTGPHGLGSADAVQRQRHGNARRLKTKQQPPRRRCCLPPPPQRSYWILSPTRSSSLRNDFASSCCSAAAFSLYESMQQPKRAELSTWPSPPPRTLSTWRRRRWRRQRRPDLSSSSSAAAAAALS